MRQKGSGNTAGRRRARGGRDKPEHRKRRKPPEEGKGMRVILKRDKGLTPKKLLRDPFYFQLPPLEEFRRQTSYSHSTFETVRRTQHSIPQARQLDRIPFSTAFIDYDPRWATYHYRDEEHPNRPPANPLHWSKELRKISDSGAPFKLSVGNPRLWGEWDVKGMLVVITSLEITEKGGEPDARYLTIEFQEYDEPERTKKSHIFPTKVTVFRDGKAQCELGHKLGDKGASEDDETKHATLTSLSKHFYGSAKHWKEIARANGGKGKGLKNWPQNRSLSVFLIEKNRGKRQTFKIPELGHGREGRGGGDKPGRDRGRGGGGGWGR